MFIHFLGCGNWRASACRVFKSHNERGQYIVVDVKDGMVARLLPKYQGFAHCFYIKEAELHMLSNSIILKLLSSFKNRLINFGGFIDSQIFFYNEKFPDYNNFFKRIPTLMYIAYKRLLSPRFVHIERSTKAICSPAAVLLQELAVRLP